MNDVQNPRWLRELLRATASNPQMTLTGNVSDYHLLSETTFAKLQTYDRQITRTRVPTVMAIAAGFWERGTQAVFVYDAVDGLRLLTPNADSLALPEDFTSGLTKGLDSTLQGNLTKVLTTREGFRPPVSSTQQITVGPLLAHLLRRAVSTDHRNQMAIIFDFASWMIPVNGVSYTGATRETELPELLRHAAKVAASALPIVRLPQAQSVYNPIVWVTKQQADLPTWLVNAPGMRTISIELPPSETRENYSSILLKEWRPYQNASEDEQRETTKRFVGMTDGLSLRDAVSIVNLAKSLEDDVTNPVDIRKAERAFRIGTVESEWDRRGLIDSVVKDDALQERLCEIVHGQDLAVQKAAEVLTRSVLGLSGSEASGSNPNRPKGVLFLAGPSGTGKTLLAKVISQQLMGDQESYTRFDMSEYAAEHSEARLVGAPPGYVGYDAGGQLTEAVRQKPFNVLLFDEIEKAHPRILDKFLQILDDGRLTDGTGATVSFSETFIIFTSNLGIIRMVQKSPFGPPVPEVSISYQARQGDVSADELTDMIMEGIEEFFNDIQRPEIFNRIGENNVVVFDYISSEAAVAIIDSAINGITKRMHERFGVHLHLQTEVLERLADTLIRDPDVMKKGGRGLNSAVEKLVLNPLSMEVGRLIGSLNNGEELWTSLVVTSLDPFTLVPGRSAGGHAQ